jgi:competence protein ComEC
MTSRNLGHRAPLLWLVLPFMAGLVAGKMCDDLPVRWLLAGSVLAAGLAVIAGGRDWRRTWMLALGTAMILAGAVSYTLNRPRLAAWEKLPPREVRLALKVDRVFPKSQTWKTAGLATVARADAPVQDLSGQRLYFSLTLPPGRPPPIRGAVVGVSGVITVLPRNPPANSFDGYLASAGLNFRLTRGRVLTVEQPAPAYRRFCARALAKFSAILGAGVEPKRPKLVAVLRAMLLGQQHELNEEQTTLFRQSGTMHVFSISGLHIAVIAGGLNALLALLRLPRGARLAVGLTALWLYVDITGAAPSAVRAFVMVALVQVSFVLRVPRNPLAALAASALCVLLLTPLDLFSASFQMSYGIVLALLLLGLPLADRWQESAALFRDLPKATWRWHQHLRDQLWRGLVAATAIGVASSLVSAVTGAQFFNLFTPGALLANLWLIPASSLVILLGLVSLLGGLAGLTAVSGLANHAAVLVLWAVDRGVHANLQLPGMWVAAGFRAAWLGPAMLAGLIASILAGYAAGWRGWSRGYWPPFVVVALTLILGVRFG